jgi:hypothetical protein
MEDFEEFQDYRYPETRVPLLLYKSIVPTRLSVVAW